MIATPSSRQHAVTAALVFLGTFLFLYWTVAHRFVLSYDEGIFLDGARRILDGQAPYRDFFILMGPGSFWLQAAMLKLFGMTLAASRISVILDFSIIAASVYWLVAQRSNRPLGIFVAALCILLETADPVVMLPNHRWDSAALAVLSVAILASEAKGWTLYLAGACAGYAALETQTVAIVGLASGVYLLIQDRQRFLKFAAGVAGMTTLAVCILAAQGALGPMLRQMLWTGTNYSQANFVSYFGIFGEYARLLDGAEGSEWIARGVVVLGIATPALLPILAVACVWSGRNAAGWGALCIGAVAMLATAWPRFDTTHLAYVAPLFYAVAAIGIASVPKRWITIPAFLAASLLVAVFTLNYVMTASKGEDFASKVGRVRASGDDAALLQTLDRDIPRGSDLFVYPYLPVAYFVTLSRNPTRYSYLQPGMMSDEDEATALAELQAAPPEHVLYYDLSNKLILRLWPHSDPSRLRMQRIEDYLARNYRKQDQVLYRGMELHVLERMPQAIARR